MAQATDQGESDLAARATEWVEAGVAFVRDRSVRPVLFESLSGGRHCVRPSDLLGLIAADRHRALIRLFDADVFGERVWATDALVGGIFVLAGVFCFWQAKRRRSGRG